jgi:ankyrin repeat protein
MKNKLLLVLFAVAFTFFASAQSDVPTTPPYAGYQITVNQTSEHYWVYGMGGKHGKGFYHDFNGWKFLSYDEAKYGNILDVTGSFGKLTARTSKDKIVTWNSNNKRWFENSGITQVKDFALHNNQIMVLGTVKQSDGTSKTGIFEARLIGQRSSDWTLVKGEAQTGRKFARFDIDYDGKIYIITTDGMMYNYQYKSTSTHGKFVTGYPAKKLKDVYVCQRTVYVSDQNGTVYRMNKSPKTYTEMRYSGNSWAVSETGTVYGTNQGKIEQIKNGVYNRLNVTNPNRINSEGNTPITEAISKRNRSSLTKAISDGGDVNLPNREGTPPIVLAVQKNSYAITKELITNKAEVDKKDKSGKTALYYACSKNNAGIVKVLLENGADANQKDAIDAALKFKNKQMVEMFVAKNADLSKGYELAVTDNDSSFFEVLSNAGVKQKGIAPFKLAVDRSNQKMVKMCLKHGANPDDAMKYAMEKRNRQAIEACLENNAQATPALKYAVKNTDTRLGESLLNKHGISADQMLNESLANASSPNTSMASMALQRGANANVHVSKAVSSKQRVVVDLLLNNGADPNKVLTESVNANNSEFAQLAVSKGATAMGSTLLKTAVKNKNRDMVSLLINAGGDATDPTLIKQAVVDNDMEMTSLLITNGASATSPELIRTAVANNKADMVQLLLNNNASAKSPELIQTSVKNKNVNITKMLITNGASATDPTLMRTAVKANDFPMCELLLANGASATDPELIRTAVKANKTNMVQLLVSKHAPVTEKGLVSDAAGHKNIDVVKLLVERGADANDGISTAVNKNHTAIAIYLLDKGASAKDPAFMRKAAGFGNLQLVTKLHQKGADVNLGVDPAIVKSKPAVLEYLITNGAKVNTPDHLYKAVQSNNVKIYRLVEGSGAPKTWRGGNGDNLLHVCARINASNVVINSLVKGGVDINAKNGMGNTPLLVALEDGRNETTLVMALVEAGADVNIPNSKGKTPLKVANGRKVKKYLKSVGASK